MSANADQIEFWNGRGGEQWVLQQEAMDRTLSRIQKAMIAFAGARAGDHIVDVGCGTGTTTLALSEAIGPSGRITGVDISKPMLAHARERARIAGKDIAFTEADAAVFPFRAENDLVFSRFGVMFFDDPPGAFANIRKALKPGGRIAFVCWRGAQENAWVTAPMGAAVPFLPPQPPADPLAPGPFAFADSRRLATILETAGFKGVRIDALDTQMDLGMSLEGAAIQMMRVGPLARLTVEIDDATRDKIAAAVRVALEPYVTAEGVAPSAACWLVAAHA